ncbi:MAG: hypothetical protein WCG52_05550 [bacterium]|jgi:hypothetical protein|nr:hypothetical protein [Spartobacteria bacterium]
MKNKPEKSLRGKLNLTIHPEIREFAQHLATRRRRSISQLFEDLVEAEWMRRQAVQPSYFAPSHDSAAQYAQPVQQSQPLHQAYAPVAPVHSGQY